VAGLLAEIDGCDDGGAYGGGELLDGAQGAAGAARLGGSDVADRDVVDAADAGPPCPRTRIEGTRAFGGTPL